MVSVGTVLAIVAAFAVIVLLYTWPYIFGRTHNEYFTDAPPAATGTAEQPVEKLLIESIPSKNLIHALAVPDIKSLEGFQSGSLNTSFDDGNGQIDSNGESSTYGNEQIDSNGESSTYGNEQIDSNGASNDVVGSGYDIQPMDNPPMSGTAAGSGAPSRLTSYTPPLANVVLPRGPGAGASAGAGYLMTTNAEPVIGYTSVNTPLPILTGPPLPPPPPAPPSMNLQVLNSGMIPITSNLATSGAGEDLSSYPSFSVSASQLDSNAVNMIKTNIVSGGQYTLNLKSDLPNVTYSFPLQDIVSIADSQNRVYAYNFHNTTIVKPGPVFFGAKTLNFQVVQTEPLPQTAPNAPPLPPPTRQAAPSGINSASSINNNSSGTSAFVTNSSQPEVSHASSAPIAQPATQVTSQMMNGLAAKLINTLITNERDPTIKMGLMTALQKVPTNGTNIPNPGYVTIYNAVATIPTNFTYTQLANMYNTLPSTTGTTKPIANPTAVLSMAPIVGAALRNTQGQVNNAQGRTQSQNQIQSQAPIPPNSVTVLKTPEVNATTNIVELQTPYPSFIFPAQGINANVINTIKTNLASSGRYTALITSDLPGLFYTFPLGQITANNIPNSSQVVNYSFENQSVQKQNQIFSRAKTLSLTVAQTAALPSTAPNAQLATSPMTNPATPWANPWAPVSSNGISSQPPSTMASIIPATATVSRTNAYTFTNQSIMLDAHTLAQKIRNAELIVKCNNYSPTLPTLSM
jgi:hypothetical protein